MKQFLLTAAFAAAGFISLNAQSSASYDDISFVPASLTSDGKAYIVGLSDEATSATILDGDLNVVKQINLQRAFYIYRSYKETAHVKSRGVGIERYYAEDLVYDGAPVTATDLDDMLQKLFLWTEQEWGVNLKKFDTFTDIKGNVSCYTTYNNTDNTDFYKFEQYGQNYPRHYFSLIDGSVKQVLVTYRDTIAQADIDNAEWIVESGSQTSNSNTRSAKWFELKNWDNKEYLDGVFLLSQTLFNDDDKWEYILPKYGTINREVGGVSIQAEDNEGIEIYRFVTERQAYIGLSIYDEDGTEIASIPIDFENLDLRFDIIGGNIYLLGRDSLRGYALYKYERTSTSVKEVLRTNGKSARISVNGRSITVDAEDQNVDEAVVYDMGGRPMVSARGRNRIALNASQLPEGLYSVATRTNGKTNGAQKIVIK